MLNWLTKLAGFFSPEKHLERINEQAVLVYAQSNRINIPADFTFTEDATYDYTLDAMTPADEEEYERIYHMTFNTQARKKQIEEALNALTPLRERYPDIRSIYNYTQILLVRLKRDEEAFELMQATLRLFPDYLFGKLTLIQHYLRVERYEKIPEILEGKYEVREHIPASNENVHISEAISFYSLLGVYYARTDDLVRALIHYNLVKKLTPKHEAKSWLAGEITKAHLNRTDPPRLADFFHENTANIKPQFAVSSPETVTLITRIKDTAPFFVTPTKKLVKTGTGVKSGERLEVTNVIDLGEGGGIGFVIRRLKDGSVHAVSLTHLNLDKKHPLYKEVKQYQLSKIKHLSQQDLL